MLSNVSGTVSQVARLSGQKSTKARPTTESTVMVDRLMSPVCTQRSRESPDCERWSPITHNRPGGTTMSNASRLGTSLTPDSFLYRYASSSALPFTVIRPLASQQTTWSLPTPITRLMKSSSDGSERQSSGDLNTMISPR
jgi:hypothetical protein